MEPQLNARYSDYLAKYLRAGFTLRQIGNTYKSIESEPIDTMSFAFPGQGHEGVTV
jgi:subfamily B ATP-binding cassette protein HlyB/CyaB